MCHMRFAFRRRQLSAVLAFVVGISVGILLISRRTRVSFISNGIFHGPISDCNANSEISLNRVLEGRFAAFLRTANFNSSSSSSSSSSQQQQPVPVGPNEHVLRILRNDFGGGGGGSNNDEDGPVFSSKENRGNKNLIFVGVMTAQKYLYTRALAVYNTWAKTLPGHVVFFTSATAMAPAELPIVRLANVDDTYPPQKKSFLMLKYMHDHFLDRYEWFMRTDDDVYVRGHLLERLLRSVNSSKPLFIGQAGMGNKEEFGQLNLDYNENFCMGGPGIVFSRETLRRVAPHVKECLKNLYSTHEDVEVGRCVRQFAGIPCTWSYEMQNIFYHNSSENLAFTGSLKQKEVHRAITLHPIKQHHHLYRLHNYMQSLKIQELQQKALTLHRELQSVIRMLDWSPSDVRTLLSSSSSSSSSPDNKSGRHWPQEEQRQQQPGDNSLNHEGKNVVDQNSKDDDDDNEDLVNQLLENNSVLSQLPSLSRYFPGNDSEVLKWDFFHRALFSHTNSNPKRKLEQPVKETLDDLVNLVMDTINKFSKQRGRVIDFKDILYGYRRVGPRHGADYILDLLLVYKKYRGRKMTIPVRKHVYLQQSFIGLETRMSPNNWWLDGGQQQQPTTAAADRKVIHFILPLAGRVDIFQRFITNFEEACLRTGQRVSLTVVVFPKASSEFSSSGAPMMAAPASSKLDSAAGGEGRGGQETTIIDVIENVQSRYPDYDIRVKMMDGPFSRAVALETGAALFGLDDLLFFVDVDVHFDVAFLDRVRLNTLQRQQVYFPIVFSQFDPTLSSSSDGAAASDRKTTTTTNVQQPRHSQSVQGQEAAESSSTSFSHNNNNNNDDLSEVDNDLGYWRHFGFGIVSLYKSDLLDIGSLDTTIQGWGKEDVDLYNKAVRSNLTIFRAAEPGLVHVFHRVECDRTLVSSQMDMCLGSKASSYASVNRLANVIYANEEILKFAELSRQNDGSLVTKQPSATSPPPPPLA